LIARGRTILLSPSGTFYIFHFAFFFPVEFVANEYSNEVRGSKGSTIGKPPRKICE
jgi:hypothetical protein